MKYTVTVTRTEIKDFTVKADTPEEAKHIAERLAMDHLWGCEPYGTTEIGEPVRMDASKYIKGKLTQEEIDLLTKIINA
jgi:hypothetical protein